MSSIQRSRVSQDVTNILTPIQLHQPSVPIMASVSPIQPPPVSYTVSCRLRRIAPKPASTVDLNQSLISSRQPDARNVVITFGRPSASKPRPPPLRKAAL